MAASTRPDLVERDSELAVLEAAVAQAVRGDGCAVAIEGPAGIGKTAPAGRGAPPGRRGGLRVLTARGGRARARVPVRRRAPAVRGAASPRRTRELALAGAAAPGRRRARRARRRPGRGAGRRSVVRGAARALLAGAQPRRRARRSCWRSTTCSGATAPSLRFVAYLVRRLEGAADPRGRDGAHRRARRGRGAARRDRRTTRPRSPCGPAPLSAEAVRDAGARERLGGEPDAAFARPATAPPAATRCCCAQLLAALHADGVRPDAAHATVVDDIGPRAVSRTVLLRLARLPGRARVAVARAVAVLGESAELRVDRGADRARRAAGGGGHRRRSCAPRSCARSRRSASSTRSCATRCTASCRPASASCSTRGRAQVLRERGARAEQVAAQLLLAPRRGDAVGRSRCCARPARSAAAQGRAGERGDVPAPRAGGAAAGDAERAGVLLELGLAEAVDRRAGRRRAPARRRTRR